MAMDPGAIARMWLIFDPAPRRGPDHRRPRPAALLEVVRRLNVVEMMMPAAAAPRANQAHVTNRKRSAPLAADAAEAVERGFAELDGRGGARPLQRHGHPDRFPNRPRHRAHAMRGGAVVGLRLALLGLTTYAETLSVYGTERAFRDGDDSPWSKAFLASAYASRGRPRCPLPPARGSEAMGDAEGKSMWYLETAAHGDPGRRLARRAERVHQLHCAPRSRCPGLRDRRPAGQRPASGVRTPWRRIRQIRKSAKLMLQFLPGTDFIFSGYSSMPREDNLFGGGNFDTEDLDDYNVLQRDMETDGGVRPITEPKCSRCAGAPPKPRRRCCRTRTAAHDHAVDAAVAARSSADMPERDVVADLDAAEDFLRRGRNGLDVIGALLRGDRDIAEKILAVQKLRISCSRRPPWCCLVRVSSAVMMVITAALALATR